MTKTDTLKMLFDAAVETVRGDTAVERALAETNPKHPDQIIAVGKAATAMAIAADRKFRDVPLLIVTKYKHAEGAPSHAEVIEAAHPVLDENSLEAGRRILDVVSSMPSDSHLLLLVSGGASALAEAPITELKLSDLEKRAQEMLGSGADIHAMNAARKAMSQIKGGKLLKQFGGCSVTTLAISDVEGDALSVIGSGIGDVPQPSRFEFHPQIVASNKIAREGVADKARSFGLTVRTNLETLYDDITKLGPRLAAEIVSGEAGLHLWGGEPTVVLPANPGQGGRNQALALIIAREISGLEGVKVLVAGTDGTDGPTDAAGAIVDGQTWNSSGTLALEQADAGAWLEAQDALLKTGPTGTNVMDLVIALKS